MASYTLYPPIVDGSMPAFIAGNNSYCRVYFSLSKFNSSIDFKNAQVSITKQITGEKVVNPIDGIITYDNSKTAKVYRSAGIIIDMPVICQSQDENIYYIDIDNSNLNTNNQIYNGWVAGIIYKIQLRLSTVSYAENNPNEYGQSTWLNAYANEFSEWSTVCVVKPIGEPLINFTNINNGIIYGSELIGTYSNPDTTESLYDYKAILLDSEDNILDESDWILSNRNINQSSIRYTFKYELKPDTEYKIKFEYNTLNGFNDTLIYTGRTEANTLTVTAVELVTLENDYDIRIDSSGEQFIENQELCKISNLFDEEEEGRIAYMLNGADTKSEYMSGIYYIRRTDSTSNFTIWTDIKRIDKSSSAENIIFTKEVYYDYTVKDGIFYKYGIQGVAKDGTRGPIRVSSIVENDYSKGTPPVTTRKEIPSIRDFNYTFLVGRDEKQLKLKLDNSISSFKINVTDTNNNTIGGVYPISRRVGNTKYKSFSVSGLISFNIDENYLFIPKKEIYNGYDSIKELYTDREDKQGVYNYMYEREFREKVLEFLTDGKVKLFKSPTEGNLLVKLSDVTCTPNQQLSRLIYSFNATVTEIAKFSVENCIKYHIIDLDKDGNRTHINLKTIPHNNTFPEDHRDRG